MRLSDSQLRSFLGRSALGGGCCGGSALGAFGLTKAECDACKEGNVNPAMCPPECQPPEAMLTQKLMKEYPVGVSYLSPGLLPCRPGGFAEILRFYPEATILASIMANAGQGMAHAQDVLRLAKAGDPVRMNAVEDWMAYSCAAGDISGSNPIWRGSTTTTTTPATQTYIDDAKAQCSKIPVWMPGAQKACEDGIQSVAGKGQEAIDKALKDALDQIPEGPPPPDGEKDEEAGLPIWAYALLAFAAAKVFRII